MKLLTTLISFVLLFNIQAHATDVNFDENVATCEEDGYIALRQLYINTVGNTWANYTNWPTLNFFNANPTLPANVDMSTWYGIQLDASNCVISINLSSNQLNGTIPSELGNLSSLTYLNLGSNQLSGSIPIELGDLNSLTSLYLYDNQLSGSIPSELGNLTGLTELNLRDNDLTGSIPPEIGNLTNAIWLRLFGNKLSGNIPSELGNMTSLQFLDLSKNQLTGDIPPELGNLANLEKLWLNQNLLTGPIPAEFGDLANLEYLHLLFNQMSGCYDSNLTTLCTQLSDAINENLYISEYNNFDADWEAFCDFGAGTCDIQCQSNYIPLRALYLDTDGDNWSSQNDGNAEWPSAQDFAAYPTSPPPGFEDLELWQGVNLNAQGCVDQIILFNNNLDGTIPIKLGDLSYLTELRLNTNQLFDGIPVELGNLSNLQLLYLGVNQLTGSIPVELGNLTNLTLLQLSRNQLTGSIPVELGNLTNLQKLYLEKNALTGSIPGDLGNLTNLTALILKDNQLSGCYDSNLMNLCGPFDNSDISNGNNLDAPWLNFCGNGDGGCAVCTAQSLDMIVYDYDTDTYTNIPGVSYNKLVDRFYTDHDAVGNAIEFIDNSVPTTNLVHKINLTTQMPVVPAEYIPFTFPQPISNDFNDVRFPFSSMVKITRDDDNRFPQGTGTMISPNHVLTARHVGIVHLGSVAHPWGLYVIPGFDQTLDPSTNLEVKVARVYYFSVAENHDIAILELEEAVGECSGWMGYGYDNDDAAFTNVVMHKADYPAFSTPFANLGFTGDDLTLSRGIVDGPLFITEHFTGQGGQSGGSAFTSNNSTEYFVRGTLSTVGYHNHVRITPDMFYSFNEIVTNNSIAQGSCLDFAGVCPDFVDLTNPESDLQNVNAKVLLTLNENLDPTINRVYESEKEILIEPGFEIKPLGTTFLADIENCPQ